MGLSLCQAKFAILFVILAIVGFILDPAGFILTLIGGFFQFFGQLLWGIGSALIQALSVIIDKM
jgi:hypothetical protein